MKEVNCDVIRDLLPLYKDDVVSPITREMVEEHLNGCPECREELRKISVPVSLPPDEDEDAVKRFLEYRAEVRRKQNVKIVRMVSVLAVLLAAVLAFCLWYTRPQSWAELTGITDQSDALSGRYLTYSGELADIVSWDLDEVDGGDDIAQKILNELNAVSYRASLRNITDRIPSPITIHRNRGGIGHISLFIRAQDHQSGASIDLFVNGEVDLYTFSPSKINDRVTYQTDGKLFDALAALIQEYGAFREI